MTMQTTTLPFQVSGANALTQQPQRNAAAGVQAPENGGFGATLSREIAQRQAMPNKNTAPAPAAAGNANRPANQNTQAKAADKPAAQGPKAAAREPAKQTEAASEAPATAQAGATADSAEAAKAGETAEDAAAAAAAAASNPVTDMLAFMASLAQPAQAAPVATTVAAETALATGAAGGEQQLAALESAFAKLEGADTAATTTAEPGLAVAAEDGDAGFALSAGVQPAAGETADLRTVQQAAQGAAQAADPAKLQAQAREAAVEVPAAAEAPAPAVTQLQAQAAKLDALNPAAMPADRIPARVGTQAWDNQVSQRVVYMIGKEQAATLTLNPPDLGPVQIVLNVSNDQASVAFSSNQLEVRQALENALPRLRDMMSESGIALGNATVDAGVADNRQAQQDGERRNQGGNGGPGFDNGKAAANDTPRPATRTVVTGGLGAVDTFA